MTPARVPQEGEEALTPHERTVLVALNLNDVYIDVLADRLGRTHGALHRTLPDACSKLRGRLARDGLAFRSAPRGGRA